MALIKMEHRRLQFISALENIYSSEEIQNILDYKLSEEEFNNIRSIARQLLKIIRTQPSICASMSSKWYKSIKLHTTVPVCVVTGHLKVQNESLFTQNVPIGSLPFDSETFEGWNGHCWIEFGGYIGDISIFRTVYAENFPHQEFRNWFLTKFDVKQECIFAKVTDLEAAGLSYIPVNVLCESDITKLVDMLTN
jgi:hypothetical protein